MYNVVNIITGEGDFTVDSTCIKDFWIAFTAIFSFINELNEFWLTGFGPTGVLDGLAVSKTLNKFNSVELSVK